MKKIFTVISSLLIVAGLKAQKTTVQKETVKPMADSVVNKNVIVNNGGTVQTYKQSHKDVKLATTIKDYKQAPAIKDMKDSPAIKDIKEVPSIKKTAPAVKDFKKTTIEQ